jgi:hypothetical protein
MFSYNQLQLNKVRSEAESCFILYAMHAYFN